MTVRGHPSDVESLMEEIVGYLAAVELFRAEGHEPTWRADPRLAVAGRRRAPTKRRRKE